MIETFSPLRLIRVILCATILVTTGCTSIAGNWNGKLVTEATNVELELSIQGSGNDHTGTWKAIGAEGAVLNSGDLAGTLNGDVVTIVLVDGNPATLTGKLENGRKITGVYTPSSPGGSGAIELTRAETLAPPP
jgi:hypothetical protein